MNIRRMRMADLSAVSQIDQLSFSAPWPPAAFEIELGNPISRCWVLEMDTPAGTRQIAGVVVIWRIVDEAHIATIAIHPDFRGLGLGRQLLKTSMKSAYEEGARIYHLEVRTTNQTAQKMYAGFGYEVVGRRSRYYKDTGEDALLMTLDLTQPGPTRVGFPDGDTDEHTRNPGTDRQ